jgi:hypothetical protein
VGCESALQPPGDVAPDDVTPDDVTPDDVTPDEIDDGTILARRTRNASDDPVESTVRRGVPAGGAVPSLPPMATPRRATYVPGRDAAPEARTYGVRAPGPSSAGTPTPSDERRPDARPGGAASSPLPADDAVFRSLRRHRRRSLGLLVIVGVGILAIVLIAVAGAIILTGKLG